MPFFFQDLKCIMLVAFDWGQKAKKKEKSMRRELVFFCVISMDKNLCAHGMLIPSSIF